MVRIRKFHITLFVPLIICTLICLMTFYLMAYGSLPLFDYRLTAMSEKNTDLHYKIGDLEYANSDLRKALGAFKELEKGFLLADNDLEANLLSRERLEKTAAGSGVLCRNIGNIKATDLVKVQDWRIVTIELSFVAEGKTVQTMNFLQKLNQEKPVVYWKNLSIRSDNKETLTLTGVVCILCKIPESAETMSGVTASLMQGRGRMCLSAFAVEQQNIFGSFDEEKQI